MIGLLTDFLERRRVRRAFGRYLRPEMLDQLMSKTPPVRERPSRRRVYFLLAQVRDANNGQYIDALEKALVYIVPNPELDVLTFRTVLGSLVLYTFGSGCSLIDGVGQVFASEDGIRELDALASQLLQQLGDSVRILTGEAGALVGQINVANKIVFDAFPDQFGNLLQQLQSTDYGSCSSYSLPPRPSV